MSGAEIPAIIGAVNGTFATAQKVTGSIASIIEEYRNAGDYVRRLSNTQKLVDLVEGLLTDVHKDCPEALHAGKTREFWALVTRRLKDAQETLLRLKTGLDEREGKPRRCFQIFLDWLKGGSEEDRVLKNVIIELDEALKIPKQLREAKEACDQWARLAFCPFEEWQYYQPLEEPLQQTLLWLRDPLPRAKKVIVIEGHFGSGKSSLARHICCSAVLRGAAKSDEQPSSSLTVQALDFPDGIKWLHCGQGCNILEKQESLLRFLGGGTPKSIDDGVSSLADKLRGKRLLIVLDDVWTSDVVSSFKVKGFEGKILVTTQNGSIGSDTDAVSVKISDRDIDHIAKPLLGSLVFRDEDGQIPEHLQDLADQVLLRCGHCPLAIAIIANVLYRDKNGRQESHAWHEVLNSWPDYAWGFYSPDVWGGQKNSSLYGAIELSLKRLHQDARPTLDVRGLLKAACIYPANSKLPINTAVRHAHEALAVVKSGQIQPSFSYPAAAMVLADYNLAQVEGNSIQVHHLVAEYTWNDASNRADMLSAGVRLIQGSHAEETQYPEETRHLAAEGLLNHASSQEARELVRAGKGIPALVDLLKTGSSCQIRSTAAIVLANLAGGGNHDIQDQVREQDGIPDLISLLGCATYWPDQGAVALSNMMLGNSENAQLVVESEGVAALLQLLRDDKPPITRLFAIKALNVLLEGFKGDHEGVMGPEGIESVFGQIVPDCTGGLKADINWQATRLLSLLATRYCMCFSTLCMISAIERLTGLLGAGNPSSIRELAADVSWELWNLGEELKIPRLLARHMIACKGVEAFLSMLEDSSLAHGHKAALAVVGMTVHWCSTEAQEHCRNDHLQALLVSYIEANAHPARLCAVLCLQILSDPGTNPTVMISCGGIPLLQGLLISGDLSARKAAAAVLVNLLTNEHTIEVAVQAILNSSALHASVSELVALVGNGILNSAAQLDTVKATNNLMQISTGNYHSRSVVDSLRANMRLLMKILVASNDAQLQTILLNMLLMILHFDVSSSNSITECDGGMRKLKTLCKSGTPAVKAEASTLLQLLPPQSRYRRWMVL